MQEEQIVVVKTLDNKTRLLFWNFDEIILVMGAFLLTIAYANFFFLIVGFVLRYFYNKYKRRHPNSVISHRLYWLLPIQAIRFGGICKRIPASCKRDWVL